MIINFIDQRLTRIIRINKTHAEKCRFTVYTLLHHPTTKAQNTCVTLLTHVKTDQARFKGILNDLIVMVYGIHF